MLIAATENREEKRSLRGGGSFYSNNTLLVFEKMASLGNNLCIPMIKTNLGMRKMGQTGPPPNQEYQAGDEGTHPNKTILAVIGVTERIQLQTTRPKDNEKLSADDWISTA